MAMSPSQEWDANAYHQLADPQFAWGKRLLETLALRGDETVLDAGCGTGRLTRLLLERLPHGHLIALDVSQQMLQAARDNLEPDFRGRVEFVHGDLLAINLDRIVQVVFSTATFHWVSDHPRLFRNLARALEPGGILLAQMGGKGNLERLLSRAERVIAEPAYQPHFEGWNRPWHFADERATAQRLAEAGFRDVTVSLFPEPTAFADRETFRRFVVTVNFRSHLQQIPDPTLRDDFIDRMLEAAAADVPPYTLDYQRLNLRATRA
jgi:trans-aconitate 2-methyltransferase